MEGIILLFEDSRGVHIPRNFAEEIRHDLFKGYGEDELEILREGCDHSDYWYVWDYILDNAEHVDENGYVWRLFQDGDGWLYCDQLLTDKEFTNLVGEL